MSTGEKNIVAFLYFIEKLNELNLKDGNKEKIVIQDLNYNLCFVDPSFRFVSIITITPFYHISTYIIPTNMLALK